MGRVEEGRHARWLLIGAPRCQPMSVCLSRWQAGDVESALCTFRDVMAGRPLPLEASLHSYTSIITAAASQVTTITPVPALLSVVVARHAD